MLFVPILCVASDVAVPSTACAHSSSPRLGRYEQLFDGSLCAQPHSCVQLSDFALCFWLASVLHSLAAIGFPRVSQQRGRKVNLVQTYLVAVADVRPLRKSLRPGAATWYICRYFRRRSEDSGGTSPYSSCHSPMIVVKFRLLLLVFRRPVSYTHLTLPTKA